MKNTKQKASLEHQLYIFQIFSVILSILLSFGAAIYFSIEQKQQSLDNNIRNAACMIASIPGLSEEIKNESLNDTFLDYLNQVISQLDYVDVITICDSNSIRLYHTESEKIGKSFVGDDQQKILEGDNPYITTGTGSLGRQRRAFFSIVDENENVVGFVMASVLTSSISQLRQRIILTFLLFALVLISIAVLLCSHFYQRLKSTLLGYNPEQFRQRYLEREEVLDTLEEGIFAINTSGTLVLINRSAWQMLGLNTAPKEGTKLVDIFPATRLMQTMETGIPEYNINFTIHNNNIISSRIPIQENGKIVGAVSIFRNQNEVTRLAEKLTGANYMVDTLRAFNHEFKNKLHVILGYAEMGENKKISQYILNTTMVSSSAVSQVSRQIQVQAIAALIIGKIMRASELNITLKLKPDSSCEENHLNLPLDVYITILGNLIENSMEELDQKELLLKEIEIGINIWDTGCILSVDDTGNGIPEELQEKIFQRGFSTKGENRGTGMYLIQDLVHHYHGALTLESEEGVGTSITITITNSQEE